MKWIMANLIWLYWIPVLSCLLQFGIDLRTEVNEDLHRRLHWKKQVERSNHWVANFSGELTLGWIVGHFLRCFIPIWNFFVGYGYFIGRLLHFIDWASAKLQQPIFKATYTRPPKE